MVGRRQRSPGSCGATRRPAADTDPSTLIGTRLRVEHVAIDAESTSTLSWAAWSPSCSVGGKAHSRSASTSRCASPLIGRCGCAMRVSIRLSTNRVRVFYDHRGWRRTAVHRCAAVEITAARTSDNSAGGDASTNTCSPSTTDRSCPSIGHRQGTGRAISSSVTTSLRDRHTRRTPDPNSAPHPSAAR